MLNTQSAYFKDQLIEKLQLMIATQELTIGNKWRASQDNTFRHGIIFHLHEDEYTIEYHSSDPKFSLALALTKLAETLIVKMHSYLKARLMDNKMEVTQ